MPRIDGAGLVVVVIMAVMIVGVMPVRGPMFMMPVSAEPAKVRPVRHSIQAAMTRMMTPEATRSQASKCDVRTSRPSVRPTKAMAQTTRECERAAESPSRTAWPTVPRMATM